MGIVYLRIYNTLLGCDNMRQRKHFPPINITNLVITWTLKQILYNYFDLKKKCKKKKKNLNFQESMCFCEVLCYTAMLE